MIICWWSAWDMWMLSSWEIQYDGLMMKYSFDDPMVTLLAVNTYTRAAQWDEFAAEFYLRLSRVSGNILGMPR